MRVRVATLNTWALPQPFGTDTRSRLRRIGAQLPRLNADVVAFQEVFSRDAKRVLVRAGREAGLTHVHNRSQVGESGLLTLSRFPIEKGGAIEKIAFVGDPKWEQDCVRKRSRVSASTRSIGTSNLS